MTQDANASLQDRVVLITGGTRGLGREMALALVEAGARVAITGAHASDAMHATIADAQVLAGPGHIFALTANVTHFEDCMRAVSETREHFGGLHVLINNAGLGMRGISQTFNTHPTRFWETDPKAWRTIIDTNLNGAFNMARAATPHLVAQGFGKILNISTSEQTMVRRGYAPYGPSKAALEAASRIWAQDLAGTGVDVNVYLPGGAADTDFLPESPNKQGADGKLLPPAIIRRAILWLCSDASNGHTGERYTARLWNPALAADIAAEGARSPHAEQPAIM